MMNFLLSDPETLAAIRRMSREQPPQRIPIRTPVPPAEPTSGDDLILLKLANCIVQHGFSHKRAYAVAREIADRKLELHLRGSYTRVNAVFAILQDNGLLRDSQLAYILDDFRLFPTKPKQGRRHSHAHTRRFASLSDADVKRLLAIHRPRGRKRSRF